MATSPTHYPREQQYTQLFRRGQRSRASSDIRTLHGEKWSLHGGKPAPGFQGERLAATRILEVRVYIDTPVLIVPVEDFKEENLTTLYQHAFTKHDSDALHYRVQPSLNVVAIFPINKDLKLVVEDNFSNVRFTPILQPVWNYLHQRSFAGIRRKLFAYFHDKKVDIFSFEKNRFKFFNSFEAPHPKDAIYFMMYIWKQLGMDQQQDELHLVGDIPDKEWLLYNIKLYIRKVNVLNPCAEFNRAPITEIKGMPFDLLTLYLSK